MKKIEEIDIEFINDIESGSSNRSLEMKENKNYIVEEEVEEDMSIGLEKTHSNMIYRHDRIKREEEIQTIDKPKNRKDHKTNDSKKSVDEFHPINENSTFEFENGMRCDYYSYEHVKRDTTIGCRIKKYENEFFISHLRIFKKIRRRINRNRH